MGWGRGICLWFLRLTPTPSKEQRRKSRSRLLKCSPGLGKSYRNESSPQDSWASVHCPALSEPVRIREETSVTSSKWPGTMENEKPPTLVTQFTPRRCIFNSAVLCSPISATPEGTAGTALLKHVSRDTLGQSPDAHNMSC